MNDIFDSKDRHRSLNLNQTLEELLGFTKPTQGVEDVSRLSSPIRPPTRYGRESTSSHSEQSNSKDSSSSPMNTVLESWRPEDSEELPNKSENTNDEFLRLLSKKRSSMTIQDRRESLRPGETIIAEEEKEDDQNGNAVDSLASSMKQSRPSSSSTIAQKTFRKTEKSDSISKSPELASTTAEIAKTSEKRAKFREELRLDLEKMKKPPAMPNGKNMSTESNEYRPSRNLEGRASFAAPIQKNEAWLRRKKEQDIERRKKEKEAEEKKKQSLEERKRAAQMTFERWKTDYDARIKTQKEEEKRKKDDKKKNEENEKNMKTKEAEKQFLAWKEVRIRSVSEERRREKLKREKLLETKENEKKQKQQEAELTFKSWMEQKKEAEAEHKRHLQELKQAVSDKDAAEKEYKSLLAQEAYETWLEIKEAESRLNSERSQKSTNLPWVPPSNTVPRQFTPSRNRRRSLDRRVRTAATVRLNRAASLKSVRSLK